MSQRVLTLELVRDGQCTPWGFRMSGGADIGTPLLVQKIQFGSPSESELQRGDLILSIGGQDARKMSHKKATEYITKSGNILKLVVARNSGILPGFQSPPTSPTPFQSEYVKPLPKTGFRNDIRSTYYEDKTTSITSQAYRTLPLITPDLKASKDVPIGSYLRFSQDTSNKPGAAKPADPYMLTKVQEAILEAALSSPRASVSSSRTSTPDIGYQNIALKQQYNSPINLYSHQAVVETLNAQTSSASKSSLGMPTVQTPTSKEPLNLKSSLAYQMVQEEEMRKKHEKKEAVETKVHDLMNFPRHGIEDYDDIQQSGSFKVLMATLKTAPKV